MLKAAYRIEVVGQSAAVKKLRLVNDELANIAVRIDEINESLEGALKGASVHFAEFVRNLSDAGKQIERLKPPTSSAGRPQGGSIRSNSSGGGDTSRPNADSLTKELRLLLREAKNRVGETGEEYEALIRRVAELKNGQKSVTDEIRSQQKALAAEEFQPGSYRALDAELVKLRASYKLLGKEAKESIGGKAQLSRIQELDSELKRIDKTLGQTFRNVGNYRDGIRGLSNAFQTLATFTVAGIGGREIIEENARISDSLADVRKTTQLSEKSLEGYDDTILNLSGRLKGLDTRSSLADLLDISRIGGQLGIVADFTKRFEELNKAGDTAGAREQLELAEEQLFSFSKAVDQVNVSLGDSLAGGVDEIALTFGRLNNLLGTKAEFGLGGGITALASAFNTLGASGEATEKNMVDFTSRLAPTAAQANLAAGDLIGLSATFDELGLSPEVTSTSFSKFVLEIGKEVEKFAEFTNTPLEEFRNLLETDVNEAILKILDTTQKAGVIVDENGENIGQGVERLQGILSALGSEGSARAAQTIGGLAGNIDKLRSRQAIANEELEIARGNIEGVSSVAAEFEVKNNNLAASLDKLKNSIANSISDPETQESLSELVETVRELIPNFAAFIKILIGGTIAGIKGIFELVKIIKDLGISIAILTAATLIFNKELRIKLLLQAKDIFQSGVLAKAKRNLIAVQKALNIAFATSPIGFVIALVAGLIIGIGKLQERYEGLRDGITEAVAKADDFLKQFGLLAIPLRFTIGLFRFLIDAVSNTGAAFSGIQAAAIQAFENIKSFFTIVLNEAKIAGLQLKAAFTFDDAKDALLDQRIQALKTANEELRNTSEDVKDAYESAYQSAVQAQAQEKLQQAERDNASPSILASLGGDSAARGGGSPQADGETDGNNYGKAKTKAELEEERKLAEKRAELRLRAAENLRNLETSLIKDEFTRRIVELENDSEDQIKNLVGDPEQIEAQSSLIRQKLSIAITDIFTERAITIAENSAQSASSIGDTNGLLPSPEKIAAAGERVNQSLRSEYDELISLQEDRLASQGLTEEQYQAQIEAFRISIRETERAQISQNNVEILNLQKESLDQRLELDKQADEIRLQQRILSIQELARIGEITESEANDQIDEAEAEGRVQELDTERLYWEQRLAIAAAGSAEYLDAANQLTLLSIQSNQERVDAQIEQDKKLEDFRKKGLESSLSATADFFGGVSDLLKQDEDRRKKYSKLIKALAIAEVGINLAREIAGINANASINALPVPFNFIVKGANIGAAIVRSIQQVQAIRKEELEDGGSIEILTRASGQIILGNNEVTPLESGIVRGARHSQGGIDVTAGGPTYNIEGGEVVVKDGENAFVINRRSASVFGSELSDLISLGEGKVEGRAERLNEINTFAGFGRPIMESGGSIPIKAMASSMLSPKTTGIPSGLSNSLGGSTSVLRALSEQTRSIEAGLRTVASAVNKDVQVDNFFEPSEIVRVGLLENKKRKDGITS